MSTILAGHPTNTLKSWTTRDLLVTAVIAVVFGLLTIGVNYMAAMLMAVNPALISIMSGYYYIPMIMAMYIIRRPGAIVVAITIAQLVSIAFNPFGWMEAVVSIFIALFYEIPFFLTQYRNFRLYILMASGAVAGLLSFVTMFAFGGLNLLAPWLQWTSFVLFILSGMLLGGWLAKALVDAIAKTGVLSGFAIAEAHQEEI